MDDDWDLLAVVRSCTSTTASSSSSSTTTATTTTPTTTFADDFNFSPQPFSGELQGQQDGHLLALPDPFEARNAIQELQDLYKPFFPKSADSPLPLPQLSSSTPVNIISSSASLCLSKDLQKQQPQQSNKQQSHSRVMTTSATFTTTGTATTTRSSQVHRSKRRKNLLKKVCQVPAEGLSSDVWSWRKYGQKPIKGSPYPRGYYRCSSSKGCLARKQVERNRSDPGMFIVTYTAEHNHPVPTHRNSLAGSTRQKPSTPPTAAAAELSPAKPSCSSPSTSAEEFAPESSPKLESRAECEDLMEEDEDDDLAGLSDVAVSDDFFAGLEEFTGPAAVDSFADPFQGSFTLPWTAAANHAATAAGGV